MSTWPPRRVVALAMSWIVALLAFAAIRSVLQSREFERSVPPSTDVYVSARVPGGWPLLLAPPILLVIVWLWSRRVAGRSRADGEERDS